MTDKLWQKVEESYRGSFKFWRYGDLTKSILYLRLGIKRAEDLIALFEKELKDKKK